MNIGIIAEYNPFHNGHRLHIERTKNEFGADKITAVMSGSFVQRGEPAIMDKFSRTKAALLNGADIVIELACVYSSAAADIFAYAGVDILNKTGIVDGLCFGSELGSADMLKEISEFFAYESNELKNAIGDYLSTGISYPKARLCAAEKILNKDLSFLLKPNNILALEYLKALSLTKSKIIPFTIKRELSDYHSTEITGNTASAAAVRKALFEEDYKNLFKTVPKNTHYMYNENSIFPKLDDLSEIFHYIIRTKSPDSLSKTADITEGLENRILAAGNMKKISDIISSVKTKRYTYTKLQRAILHIILNINKEDEFTPNINPYIRVLGFRKDSAELLSRLKKNAAVPVIINPKKDISKLNEYSLSFFEREKIITDIYYQLTTRETSCDYTKSPVIV